MKETKEENVENSLPSIRRNLGLKANPEDDAIVKEIVKLFAQKGIAIDRAYRVLKDVRTMLPHLAKLPYEEDFK